MNSSLIRVKLLETIFENLANDKIILNSEEKYQIFLNLQDKIDTFYVHKFFVSKKKGQSTSSIFLDVKTILTIELCNYLLRVISEELFKKFTYYPRAYKNDYDFISKVKEELHINNQYIKFYTKITLSVIDKKLAKIWLLKNFPFKKREINSLLINIIRLFSYSTKDIISSKTTDPITESYYLLINFIIHKLTNRSLEERASKKKRKRHLGNSSILMKNKNTLHCFSSNKTKQKQNLTLINIFLKIRGITVNTKKFYNGNLERPRLNISNYFLVKSSYNRFICLPSNNYLCFYKNKLKMIIKSTKSINVSALITLLNKELKFWKYDNFFLNNFQKLSKQLDHYLHRILWKYVKRLHSRRSNSWIYKKYWKYISGNWCFVSVNQSTGKINILLSHSCSTKTILVTRTPLICNVLKIVNFKKVYYIKFLKDRIALIGILSLIYHRQKGLCYKCKLPIDKFKMKVCHIRKRVLILVHSTCKFSV